MYVVSFIICCHTLYIKHQWANNKPPLRIVVQSSVNEHIVYLYIVALKVDNFVNSNCEHNSGFSSEMALAQRLCLMNNLPLTRFARRPFVLYLNIKVLHLNIKVLHLNIKVLHLNINASRHLHSTHRTL